MSLFQRVIQGFRHDKRSTPRFKPGAISCKCEDLGTRRLVDCSLANISTGGLALFINESPLDIARPVQVTLQLPTKDKITQGKVIGTKVLRGADRPGRPDLMYLSVKFDHALSGQEVEDILQSQALTAK